MTQALFCTVLVDALFGCQLVWLELYLVDTRVPGINRREVKSLSALSALGNRGLVQKLKRERKDRAGSLGRGQEIPRVEPMNELRNLPTVVRFGAFEVSFESREIRKHGMRIQLEEKPFQILEALIESAGQVVNRKALCEKLWPNTYVAFDHSLNTAINKLRSVLGDSAQSTRFIETRPRLGYCFVAPVERSNGERVAAAAPAASAAARQTEHSAERGAPEPLAPEPRAPKPQVHHHMVMASAGRGSSRPQQAEASHLQAKSCQTAQ